MPDFYIDTPVWTYYLPAGQTYYGFDCSQSLDEYVQTRRSLNEVDPGKYAVQFKRNTTVAIFSGEDAPDSFSDATRIDLLRSDSSPVVLPSQATTPDRTTKTGIKLFTGETISVSITLYESDGTTPLDLTGATLVVVIESEDGEDIAVVSDADISIGGDDMNVVSFLAPEELTTKQRLVTYAIRRATGDNHVYATGTFRVQYAPSVDS